MSKPLALAIAAALVALALAATAQPAPPPVRPYSCRLLDEAERKCAFGMCDKRELERLRKECLRDGGRP